MMNRQTVNLVADTVNTNNVVSVLSNASVSIYTQNSDGTQGPLATVYSAPSGTTAIPQPFVTDNLGRIPGYLEPGDYLIVLTYPNQQTVTATYAVPEPLGSIAQLGSDGTVGGPGGSPLSPSLSPPTPTPVQSSAYAAAPGQYVPVNATAGSVTVTLPATPPDGTSVGVKLVSVTAPYVATVATSGGAVFDVTGGATSLTLGAQGQGVMLRYQASAAIWFVTTSNLPLDVASGAASLDSNSVPIEGMPVANVTQARWGAKADAVLVTDAAMTSGSALLSSASQYSFTSADVGKAVVVQGCGANISGVPGPLKATISSVSGGVATLSASASNTQTGVQAAFGTPLAPALSAAHSAGYRCYLPAGRYLWDTTISTSAAPHIEGDVDGRTVIYFSSLYTLLNVTGPGLQGSASSLSANANPGDQTLAVSSVPTGLMAGDYIFLSSTDFFDASEGPPPVTKCGELLRVQGISGNTLALWSPVCGPNVYYTTSSAQVQKITFLEGVRLENLQFINAAPEVTTQGFATPGTQTICAGGASGIMLQYCRAPRTDRIRVTGWGGTFIQFGPGTISAQANHCHFRDGAKSITAGSYGYGITNYGSQWCHISDCIADSVHGFLNNSGSGGINPPVNMPSRYNVASDCQSLSSVDSSYLFHYGSTFCDYVDCHAFGGPLYPPENSHGNVFMLSGHYNKVIRPTCIRCTGRPIQLAGDGCEAIDALIRYTAPWNDRCDAIYVSVGVSAPPGATITGQKIIGPDILGVLAPPSGYSGNGINIAINTPNVEIHNARIRNTAAHGVQIQDTSDTTIINNLFGENIGSSGNAYLINDSVTSPAAQWQGVRGINVRTAITNAPSGLIPVTYGETLNGTMAPDPAIGYAALTPTANSAYFARFVPKRRMTIVKIAFVVNTVATANDSIDVGIYDQNANRLVSAGSTAGVVNGSAGVATVSVASTVLAANTPYYVAFAYGTVGGTAAKVDADSNDANLSKLFGNTFGTVLRGYATTSFPLPATASFSGYVASVPYLAVRES